MSTISAQDKKPPSAGTKVDLGAAAPTRPEAPGPVPPDSLAAESASHGGEFAKNRGVDPNTLSSSGSGNDNSSSRTGTGAAPGSGAPSKAEPAPTYVLNQYIRDPKGPHGKNIHEGIDDEGVRDGVQEAFRAEPGSENDPARVAERELLKSKARTGRYAGPRETEISGPVVYERLDSDVQA
ncbi:uncharacterized protein LY79DRAFT_564582 [Colletotrichum navitas]|uniref:Uncharacterized protein n=1 Tax=Colletotrichum navitas TaxID=681940 RepID=A0AAD8PSP7_9PEZI|nr:uncharacterized protein LY79DRAFT_564582 [Colletotrichum navitas]KAK1579332.1 hypothetical protein LY79DRAFT_564582 [Colletotrichum navitas]